MPLDVKSTGNNQSLDEQLKGLSATVAGCAVAAGAMIINHAGAVLNVTKQYATVEGAPHIIVRLRNYIRTATGWALQRCRSCGTGTT